MGNRGLSSSMGTDPIASAIAREYFSLLSDLAEEPDSPADEERQNPPEGGTPTCEPPSAPQG